MWAYLATSPDGQLIRTELPRPQPAAGQVLVRVSASSLNPLDIKIRAGKAQHARHPLPAVLGLDMSGVIEEIGEQVSSFQAGDEVYGMVGGVAGLQGTLAEFVVADADLLARKPRNLSMREAAALPLVTITAWEGLVDRAKVQTGQKVLIHAGAGGVGHVAVQIAKSLGAVVFATVSAEKRRIVEQYGAVTIDYRSRTVVDGDRAVLLDVIYDTVGGATLDDSFQAVKRYTGHVVSCLGWTTHSLAPLSFRGATYSGVFTLLPLLTGQGRAHHGMILTAAAALAETGQLRPLLNERSFSFDELEAAFQSVAAGGSGKVVATA